MNNSRFKLYLIITLIMSGLLPVAGSMFLHLFLSGSYWISIPLHSVIEALGSFTALSLAVLILSLRRNNKVSSYYIWISCALIAMGILDVFHAFTSPDNSFVWLHSIAVLAGGFLFSMIWLPDRIAQSRISNVLYMVVAVATFIPSIFVIYSSNVLPAMINGNNFTPVANTINMLGGLFFLSAAAYFIIRYRFDHNHEDFLFVNFCLLNGWAGLLFQFSQIWHADWWFWHLLRLVAYLIVLSFMFITFQHSEEELKQHREHLEELVQKRTTELKITNEQLQQEIDERIRVEEKLHRAHKELELRVQERTVKLAKANETLQAEIIERKRAEEALRDRESKLSAMINCFEGLIYICSPDYRIEFMNEQFIKNYGSKKVIGELCYKILQNRDSICPWCVNERVFRGETVRWEVQIPKDGHWYYAVNTPIYHQNGSVSKQAMALDITERKRAEEKILEQAALLDKAHDAIGVRDLEHNLIYWNKGAERLYGWTAEEVIGKNPIEFMFKGKEEPPQLIEAKRIVLEKGEWMGELRQMTKEGKEIIVESRWTLVQDGEGKPKSILIINTDMTEKKNLEAQFLRAQRMESIGTLAGGIAHDINNILTPMMLSLQLLQEKLTDTESQKLLEVLERSTQRGASLVKQIQSFARGMEGERVALQVSHLIYEIVQIAKETFPRSIDIKTDISKDLWTTSGDATQLHQVIMNICVNARDAMPAGGTLSISAGNIFIDESYARINIEAKVGPYVVITVSDTGTGIPPKIIDRIFDPFFTTKQPGKGTGIGLSTALTIVKSHGGFINVYSEVGRGTVFKIYLPVAKTTEVQKGDEQLELPAGHGESILVVDDEPRVLEVTKSILKTHGYRVITANDGKEAISLCSQHNEEIKVVLMDMMMPVMDGPASIRELHKVNPDIKIIGVSGLTEKDKLAEVAGTHIHAFLTKPYTAEKLLKNIYVILNGK